MCVRVYLDTEEDIKEKGRGTYSKLLTQHWHLEGDCQQSSTHTQTEEGAGNNERDCQKSEKVKTDSWLTLTGRWTRSKHKLECRDNLSTPHQSQTVRQKEWKEGGEGLALSDFTDSAVDLSSERTLTLNLPTAVRWVTWKVKLYWTNNNKTVHFCSSVHPKTNWFHVCL